MKGPVGYSPGVRKEAARQLEQFGVIEKLLDDAEQHQYSISRVALRTLTLEPVLQANDSGKVTIGVTWDQNERSRLYTSSTWPAFRDWINEACARLGVIGEVATAVYDPIDNEYLLPEEAQGKLAHLNDHVVKLGEVLGIKPGSVPRLKRELAILQVNLTCKQPRSPGEIMAILQAEALEETLLTLD